MKKDKGCTLALPCLQVDEVTCQTCRYFGEPYCSNVALKDAMKRIKQLEAKAPKWISVKDRLPEEKESVLVHYVDGWMTIAFLLGGKWYQSGGETSWLCVTHWMPMPEPPKEEEHDS